MSRLAPAAAALLTLGACHLHSSADIVTCDDVPAGCDTAGSGSDTGPSGDDADGDGIPADQDCDDDDADVGGPTTWYSDADGDGWGLEEESVEECDQPSNTVADPGDCDDSSADASPDIAEETCGDGLDNNCDGTADGCQFEGEQTTDDAVAQLWTEVPASYSYFGHPLALDHDLTGDGVPEIVVSQIYAQGGSGAYGATYVFEGDAVGDVEADDAFSSYYGEVTDYLGSSVATGDVDGDGQADLVSGAYGYSTEVASNPGVAAVWLGPLDPGSSKLGEADMLIPGLSENDYTGWAVGVGDVTGEGPSVISAGIYVGTANEGAVYVMPANNTDSTAVDRAVAVIQDSDVDYLGTRLDAGDLDGDGVDDLVVSATWDASYAGSAFVFHGPLTGELTTKDASLSIRSTASNTYFGDVATVLGDVDGDGLRDVGLGAYRTDGATTDSGAAYVYAGPVAAGDSPLATFEGNAQVTGVGASLDSYDFDGDTVDDLLIGSSLDGSQDGSNAGAARLFYGPLSGSISQIDSDAKWRPTVSGTYFGRIAGAGDVDGDGDGDVVIGSHLTVQGNDQAMGAWIFAGVGL